MYSKVTPKKVKRFVKDFTKMLNLYSPAMNCVSHLRTKILIQVFSVQRLFISLFLLAIMLVMLVKRTNTSQPLMMNTLVRIKWHTKPTLNVINWLFECLFTWLLYYSRYCKNKASVILIESLFIAWLKTSLSKQIIHQYIICLSIWPLLC